MARLSAEALSSIVSDVYDCALNPEKWTATLTRISNELDAAFAMIGLFDAADPARGARTAQHSPWDSARLNEVTQVYGAGGIPGLMDVMFGDIDTPHSVMGMLTEDDFQKSAFYQNWVRPQNLRDSCITKFVHTQDRIGLMGLGTYSHRDIITADERRFLGLLSPHVRRAAMIGDLLDHQRAAVNLYRTAIDELATPIVLTDRSGRIVNVNRAAEDMLSRGTPITLRNGVLSAPTAVASDALADAIARSSAGPGALGTRGIGIPLSAPGSSPAIAYVLPLSGLNARPLIETAVAAIFISTTTAAAPPPEAALVALFDLTPAEARVFCKIGSGLEAADATQQLKISANTMKTHLGRIYAKTGTTRQADIIKLYGDIAPPAQYRPGEPR